MLDLDLALALLQGLSPLVLLLIVASTFLPARGPAIVLGEDKIERPLSPRRTSLIVLASCVALAHFLEGFAIECAFVFLGRLGHGWVASAARCSLSVVVWAGLIWRAEVKEWRGAWIVWTGAVALLSEAMLVAAASDLSTLNISLSAVRSCILVGFVVLRLRPRAHSVEPESSEPADDSTKPSGPKKNKPTGSYIQFFRRVSKLAPLLWPKGEPKLQLLMVLSLSLAVPNAVLKSLSTLSLGWALDGLTNPDHPWQGFKLWIAIQMPFQLAFLPILEEALWLPVEQHIFASMETMVFKHLLSLSFGWHLNQKIGKTLAVAARGSSMYQLLRFAIFNFLPTILSLCTSSFLVALKFGPATFCMLITVLLAYAVVYTIGVNVQRDEYGKLGSSREAIEKAAESARLADQIRSFSKGFDTSVGERGLKLSGGQKQRVSLARIMLKDPQILLLDEATSALDSNTEEEVQQALDASSAKRTSLAIAHRLSSIMNPDQIVVISKGQIIERGSHAELLAVPDGAFAKLWDRQTKRVETMAAIAEEVELKEILAAA